MSCFSFFYTQFPSHPGSYPQSATPLSPCNIGVPWCLLRKSALVLIQSYNLIFLVSAKKASVRVALCLCLHLEQQSLAMHLISAGNKNTLHNPPPPPTCSVDRSFKQGALMLFHLPHWLRLYAPASTKPPTAL